MHLRGKMTRKCHATSSASPDTRGIVGNRLKTISVVRTFFPLLLPQVLIATQFLLFSETPMVLPNFLNHYVIPQALVGQVDNQKRFQGYLCPLVHFAAFSIRG